MFFDDLLGGLKDYAVWVVLRAADRAREDGDDIDPAVIEAAEVIQRYMVLDATGEDLARVKRAMDSFVQRRDDTATYDLAVAVQALAEIDKNLDTAFEAIEHLRSSLLLNDTECDTELARRLRSWADELDKIENLNLEG